MQTAESLGYVPNLPAQSLSGQHAAFVAVVLVDLLNPLQSDLADRVRTELASRGIFALMTTAAPRKRSGDLGAQVEQTISALADLRPRGVVIVGSLPNMDAIESIPAPTRVCVVSAMPHTPHNVHVVRVDDDHATRLLLDHAVTISAQRVAFVGGEGGLVSQRRLDAFIREAASRQLDTMVVRADYGYDEGRVAGEQLIASGFAPEAVIAHNDLTAVGVQAAYVEAGLSEPEVMGFDNIGFSAMPQIRLITIDQQNDAIAHEAVRWLLSRDEPTEVLVPPQLVLR